MHAVKSLGFGARQMRHAGSDHFQSSTLETGINLTNHIFSNRVRFDDGERLFNSHKSLFFKSYFPAAGRRETARF